MKLLSGIIAPAILLASCSEPSPRRTVATAAQMTALNDQLVAAYEREDVAVLRTLLSDRHIHNNVFGTRLTKDEFLKDIESGVLVFDSYKTPEIEWFIGGDLAVATGVIEAKAVRDGRPVPATTFRFTRVFALEGGDWKVLLFQNTMVPQDAESPAG